MIVCLFGVTYRDGYDAELERSLDEVLRAQLRHTVGFHALHLYNGPSGEVLGVVRFASRAAALAWRNDSVHRSAWRYAPELYENFWIQICESYREYGWSRQQGRTNEDLVAKFAQCPSNLAGASDLR